MKVTITEKIEKEVDIKYLVLNAEVSNWSESLINGRYDTESGDNAPCNNFGFWCPKIEIETGIIVNWENGKRADIDYAVFGECGWQIENESGEIVLYAKDGYVPKTLYPKTNGSGINIIMDIDENGQIANWNFNFYDFYDLDND